MSPGRRPGWRFGALLGLLAVACGPDPVAVLTGLEIVVAGGDGQFGTVGQRLTTPLRAVVRVEATQKPREDVNVHWEVLEGGATLESAARAVTDETGSVEMLVRLGATPADVTVRASIESQPGAGATFTLHTIELPVLSEVMPAAVEAGDTVTLTGENFSPVAVENVVLMSGVRARVLGVSGTQLSVEVPTCLPSRTVSVTVQLGVVASGAVPLTITGGTVPTSIPVGEVLDASGDEGFQCFALAGDPGAEYLAVVYAASTVGAAMHPYRLTALSSSVAPSSTPGTTVAARIAHPSVGDPQAEWDTHLRTLEGELVSRARGTLGVAAAARAPAATTAAATPEVGDVRTFHVYAGGAAYEDVTAQARYIGEEAAIFIDQDAPSGGFNVLDIEALASRFDDVIYPVDTGVFGAPSDLDQNGRVIILFTPVVNGLTEPGASGFVGGFFHGNDLLPENSNSNAGEIFYALVPDPTGRFSDPRPKDAVLEVVPAVLAHEFQHMIHFNQRYLSLDGGQEALWLSEALAQMAEELVARAYDELGDAESAEMFRSGARVRSRRYLGDTAGTSVIVSTGQGSLTERGAGFLHLLYLTDHEGSGLLGRLTRTTRTGVANVESEVGREWSDI
ncbi:MAG: IPT/TIG domain-containing protein, partial [Gemmatimonadota bacterium]